MHILFAVRCVFRAILCVQIARDRGSTSTRRHANDVLLRTTERTVWQAALSIRTPTRLGVVMHATLSVLEAARQRDLRQQLAQTAVMCVESILLVRWGLLSYVSLVCAVSRVLWA